MKHVTVAKRYARQVRTGKIPACVHVKQACARFEKDLNRKRFPYRLEEKRAEKWCNFLELLPHVKGRWARGGATLELSAWQTFLVVNLFGWVHKKTRMRRFREAYVEVPRKNGKSFLVAGIGLGMLTIDGEIGAEVYCGATTEKQAWFVFEPAKKICERLPDIREEYGIEIWAKAIIREKSAAKFEPIIGDPGDGASPSCAIADEFHEHADAAQVSTMETGMGAREQPLMLYITTAGDDMGGPCYEKRDDVIKILKGTVSDDTVFGIIYAIDADDRWDTVEAQKKANPNYGISVDPEFLAGKLRQARRSPSKQATYKTKHLNVWVGARAAWMNMLRFQACRKARLSLDDYLGERCLVGLDLASRTDVASMCQLFPPTSSRTHWAAFFRRWVPEARLLDEDAGDKFNDRYKGWHAGGWLETTPGEIIDFDYIEEELKAVRSDYEILEVPYDPFQATQFAVHMGPEGEGFPMVEYGATVRNFSEPMKETEALILERLIRFQMDPMLMWMMGNVTARRDKKDNIFPTKDRIENKIDDVVALIMCVGRAMLRQEKQSVYERQGVLLL